jgi:predicted ABC-type ATPase
LQRPSLVIVAGVNGCGKSTFASKAAGKELLLGQTAINPDLLTHAVATEFPKIGVTGANLVGVERAEKAVWKAIAEGRSAAIETVLSSDKFVAVVQAAAARRYRTRLIFIGLPTVDLALERIAVRVKQGGHAVPEARVRDRWARAHDNLVKFNRLVHDVLVFSNVGEEPTPVAERVGRGPMRLLNPDALPDVTARLA